MDKDANAIKTDEPIVAPVEEVKVVASTEDDLAAKVAELEAEKAKITVEAANYKLAFLKEKSKKTEEPNEDEEESIEDKMRRIAAETLANSRIAAIEAEKDALIQKALKENKELKLANLNKTVVPPAAMGIHTESPAVVDTLITAEQMQAFKVKGWSDKDIERYKTNLKKYGGR
jgi:hypothetical protein